MWAVQQQVLEQGQARKTMRDLKRTHQAGIRDAIGTPSGDGLTRELYAAGVWADHAGDTVEQRGLTGTIGTDQPGDATLLH